MTVTDRDVRYLLRRLHQPDRFAHFPLAVELRRAFPAASLRESVSLAVHSAFAIAPGGDECAVLRDIIVRSDIERSHSAGDAAAAFGMGMRTYVRKRSRAVTILTQFINRTLSDRTHQVLLAYSRCGISASNDYRCSRVFARARHEFDAARECGDAFAMEESIGTLHGYGGRLSVTERLALVLMNAELNIALGRFSAAWEMLDRVFAKLLGGECQALWPDALLVDCELNFAIGNLTEAQTLASAVHRERAAVLLARIALLNGELPRKPASRSLWFDAVEARRLLQAQEYAQAQRVAERTYVESLTNGVLPVACWSAATLAACAAQIDPRRCNERVGIALHLLAACSGNACIARDLFQFDVAREWIDATAFDGLARIFTSLTPESRFATSESEQRQLPNVLARIWSAAQRLRRAHVPPRLGGTVPVEARYLGNFAEFLKVLVPFEQQAAFVHCYRAAANAVIREITRERSYERIRSCAMLVPARVDAVAVFG